MPKSLGEVPVPTKLPATIVLCIVRSSVVVKIPPCVPVPLASESARFPVMVELRMTVGAARSRAPALSTALLPLKVELMIVAPDAEDVRNIPAPLSSVLFRLIVLATIVTDAPESPKIAPPSSTA